MSTEPSDPAAWEEAFIADLRANGGRPSQGPLKGDAILLLYSTGAKTGERRRSILTYSRDGDAYVVAGTAGGSKIEPKWVRNVEQHPQVEIEVDTEVVPATGEVVRSGPERDRLWEQHVAQIPRFAEYPSQVGERVIPLVRLRRA